MWLDHTNHTKLRKSRLNTLVNLIVWTTGDFWSHNKNRLRTAIELSRFNYHYLPRFAVRASCDVEQVRGIERTCDPIIDREGWIAADFHVVPIKVTLRTCYHSSLNQCTYKHKHTRILFICLEYICPHNRVMRCICAGLQTRPLFITNALCGKLRFSIWRGQ